MRRDTIGNSGTTKRMSIGNFARSLVQYMGDSSKKDAGKIVSPKTGLHMFPSVPEVSVPLWNKVQKYDILRLLLSVVDGPETVKAQWQRDLDFFQKVPIEDGENITDLIQKFRDESLVMSIPRTTIPVLTMPTQGYIKSLTDKKLATTYLEAERLVNEARSNYELLISKPDDYKLMFPMNSPEDTLNLMDSFNYIKPLPKKSGQMFFLYIYVQTLISRTVVLNLCFYPYCLILSWKSPTLHG